ncbi:jg12115 [Pararge aegeria aegeria]|uniref:Jg12115 protein n=1 Tax=Pararge aegeria aegeria TaxID=348720 RepID=A0A8S4QM60_9NEOP|nr:jg12115 [Pararge aegeria aegeria]
MSGPHSSENGWTLEFKVLEWRPRIGKLCSGSPRKSGQMTSNELQISAGHKLHKTRFPPVFKQFNGLCNAMYESTRQGIHPAYPYPMFGLLLRI